MPTQNRARQGGQSGPIQTEAAATGGSQSSGRPTHRRAQQPQTQAQHQRPSSSHLPPHTPQPTQPMAQQPPQWQPPSQTVGDSTWSTAAANQHTAHAGTQQHQPWPTAGHQQTHQPATQASTQPQAEATVWEAFVPPHQLRPLPHSTATQPVQQPQPQQPAGQQSLAAIHSKPTALYHRVFQPSHQGGSTPPQPQQPAQQEYADPWRWPLPTAGRPTTTAAAADRPATTAHQSTSSYRPMGAQLPPALRPQHRPMARRPRHTTAPASWRSEHATHTTPAIP